MKTPWLVGLTGGIGSGKSTVARLFAEQQVHVVDADDAARWVVEPGEPGLAGLVELAGKGILQANGRLDRAALRERIFAEDTLRAQVEQLLHPLIRQAIADNLAQATSEYAVLVSPLLIERGQYRTVQRVLVVDIPLELQKARVMARDAVAAEQVQAIMQTQLSSAERLRYADDVIRNDAGLEQVAEQVVALHKKYLELATGANHAG